MPDSKKYLHLEAIRRISRLDLRARHIVEGFLSGMHRSPYFGQSVEFLQHREYSFGDDLRHVDWKVWAKQDRFYIKQYEEDTNMCCTLLVDASRSMQYGNGIFTKYEYACTIAATLAYLLLKQQDSVGCVVFDEAIRAKVPSRSKKTHIHSVIESLSLHSPKNKTRVDRLMRTVAETYPRRGMMILVTDMLSEDEDSENVEEILKGLKLLRQRGHDVLVFHVMDDDELDFPFSGTTRFDGIELPGFLNCNPRALREGYLEALQQFLEKIRLGCARNGIDYSLIRTSAPLDAVLATYLSNRLGMHHRN